MIIKSKLESINKINALGLNKFPEQLFRENEEIKVKEFIEKYPANYYAIRDKSRAGGTFKLKTDIFDKRLNRVPHFDFIYQYIMTIIFKMLLWNLHCLIKK